MSDYEDLQPVIEMHIERQMIIRTCYFPNKGCPSNKGEECYAPYYPDRISCETHSEFKENDD